MSITLGAPSVPRHSNDELKETAAGTEVPGDLKQVNGKTWQLQGLKKPLAGSAITWRSDRVIEVTKESASDTYAIGAEVHWDATAKVAKTAAGDFIAGKARVQSTANDATVIFALNE